MATIPPPLRGVRLFGKAALVVMALGAATLIGYGFYELKRADQIWGLPLMAGGMVSLALGILLYGNISLAHKVVNNTHRTYGTLLDLEELIRRQNDYARTIAENSSLSDWAKRVVYREKDYEFLRDSINSAIVRQDWEGVERCIRDLDEQFGMHEEAARLRVELERARRATTEERIAGALKRFESLCERQKWAQAQKEIERLKTLFPNEPRIAGLPQELEMRKQQYKRKLLKDYDEAVRVQNVDLAHRLLVELDHYLTPDEVAVLKESARGVFKARLFQLGVQFSVAIQDKAFSKAISIGERIIREFPNSRYAQEISGMMPALRQRAGLSPQQNAS